MGAVNMADLVTRQHENGRRQSGQNPGKRMKDESMQHRNHAPALPAFVTASGSKASESYMEFFERQSVSCTSIYRSYARRFFSWAEGQGATLTAVGQEHVKQYHRYLLEEAGPNMAANSFSVINRLFQHMHETDGLPLNPAAGLHVASPVRMKKIRQLFCEQWECHESDEVTQAALVMLAPVLIATFSLKAIRSYTQLPFSTVQKIADRLYDQGIWVRPDSLRCEWFDEECEHRDFAILMDALVAAGQFDRNENMACSPPKARYEDLKAEDRPDAVQIEVTRTVREEKREIVTVREASETIIERRVE